MTISFINTYIYGNVKKEVIYNLNLEVKCKKGLKS